MTSKLPLHTRKTLVLLPAIGIGLFVVLYLVAAGQYPGGSNADRTAQGFSWVHNYWCDLLSDWAKNGEPNPGSAVAIAAMTMLCLSLATFWYLLPDLLNTGRHHYQVVQYAGVGSMLLSIFVFSNYHDMIIMAAVALGVVALAGTYVALFRSRSYALLGFGIICLLFILANSYIYYSKQWIVILPLLQKVTFVLYLLWILLINRRLWLKTVRSA